jgi:predicted dehydrogenase
MSEKLTAGIIGLGILGGQHMRFLSEQPEIEVKAVADIRKEVVERAAHGVGAQAYEDYEEMLKRERLDIVVVATPDPLHRQPVVSAIQTAVPNIILEKPMATTVPDAEAMLDAAEKKNARIFVNFANRGSSPDQATYYVVKNGLLGDIVYGEVRLDDNISVPIEMWGDRTREWAAGSSSAHFLLSHVVDYLSWILSPSAVVEVYAIVQRKVLGYTPDLYDAFLTFDSGIKFRVKAEWIKHIDGLVEFRISFSGKEGSLACIKRAAFGEVEGWRANVSAKVTAEQLMSHQNELLEQGINVKALLHRPIPTSGELKAGGGELRGALETFTLDLDRWRVCRGFIDAIVENSLTPSSWRSFGPLPTGVDGMKQTQIVCAIVESADKGKVVSPNL